MVVKTVLITGCSAGGIGSALALAFQKKDFQVFATARNISKMEHLTQAGIFMVSLDVTSAESIAAAVKVVEAKTGARLDILVNSCGIGYVSPLLDASLEETRKVFETNVFGLLAIIQAFSHFLIAANGTILNIGSIAGMNPKPWSGVYNAACGAVHQLSDTMRLEPEPLGVKVVLVITGSVKTRFLSNLSTAFLLPNSIYTPAKETIESTMNAAVAGVGAMSAEVYAEAVVANLLKQNPNRRIWVGNLSTTIWAVHTFMWDTAWDWLLAKPFGLTDLRKQLSAKTKAM